MVTVKREINFINTGNKAEASIAFSSATAAADTALVLEEWPCYIIHVAREKFVTFNTWSKSSFYGGICLRLEKYANRLLLGKIMRLLRHTVEEAVK